jgi:hypothetical protein
LSTISKGPIVPAPNVAMFTITYPEISVTVGLVYMLNGLWGVGRAYTKPNDDYFPMSLGFQWFLTVALMILTQISYLPLDTMAYAAPTRGCLMLAAHVMPAFLDFKARTTPEVFDNDYYGLDSAVDKHADEEAPVESEEEEGEVDVKNVEEQPRRATPTFEEEEVAA